MLGLGVRIDLSKGRAFYFVVSEHISDSDSNLNNHNSTNTNDYNIQRVVVPVVQSLSGSHC